MAYGNTLGMSYEDFDKYLQNKKAWETGSGADTARANFENSKLREKYGITEDNMSYNDLMWSNAYYNPYTTDRDKSVAALGNYTRYKDPYNRGDLRQKLDNFVYNPENDPNFQVYRDMYARQGQAAQGQTLANLTALSGGRNNSWASAATAQVGQAYAQKTADMIPQLAQQAYNKLLQRYNIEAQESDRAYGRWIDAYGRTREMADLYNTLGQQEMQNKRQRLFDEQQYGMNELDRQIKEFGFNLDRQWAPAERAINLGLLQQALLRGEIELEALPEQIRLGLEQGYYNVEQVKQAIAKGEIELKYLPAMYEADIAATNRSNRPKSGGGGGGISGMKKSDLKEWINYNYKGADGKLNKGALLKDLTYGDYTDAEVSAIISTSGITKAEIKEWQKTYAETINNYMFPYQNLPKNALDIPY